MSEHRSLKTQEREIETLVSKAQEGNTDAFAKLYDIFFTPVYRYVYYRVRIEDYEDIIEIVFLKIWTNVKKYRVTDKNSSFISWVFRIAHNVVIDYYRDHRETIELTPDIPDHRDTASIHTGADQKINNGILKSALGRLKEPYQQVLVLKFLDDLDNTEIATILGKSQNSLRILQFRALKSLRNVLEEMGITNF